MGVKFGEWIDQAAIMIGWQCINLFKSLVHETICTTLKLKS